MPLPVHLAVPDAFRARAAYALETLLDGLNLAPAWTDAAPVLSVGIVPAAAPVALAISPAALDFFASRRPYRAADAFLVATPGGPVPVLWGTPDQPDWVSSAFYWLSGWGEGGAARVDRHGRAPFEDSLQHALGIAHVPVVDAYAAALGSRLAAAGWPPRPRLFSGNTWMLCPTHDVDARRKWTPKSLWRLALRPAEAAGVVRHGDPYRRGLERLVAEENRRGVGATYYFKGGAGAPEDHAYRLSHPDFRAVFGEPRFEVGLHPSYHAFDQQAVLEAERARLARAARRPVEAIRMHYLRFRPAHTPALLDALGFTTDSTLGWPAREGWRRGTCRPFRLFDESADRATEVWEMPLALMDATLFGYRALDADAAWHATRALLDAARHYGGACVALWHNNAWDGPGGRMAGAHFVRTLDAALDAGAHVASVGEALRLWQAGAR